MAQAPRKRIRWWHLYLALLVASAIWQTVRAPEFSPGADQRIAELPRMDAAGERDGAPVGVAYRDRGSGEAVIYLHGSPGSGDDGRYLAEELGQDYRFVSIDLPGFGASERWLPDYGLDTHARYVLALMERLNIDRAHIVAHSMGSGVAFEMTRLAPLRVRSIVSYAGIGVQEAEGSGDFHLEHAKYAAGYGLLVVAPELIPHFGWLGPRASRHAFIRNFWDTDQRPLRPIIDSLPVPLLLLHGGDDPLVPLFAAEEHHRIAERSRLVIFDRSHFMVFTRQGSSELAEQIEPFLQSVSRGDAFERRRLDLRVGTSVADETLPTDLDLDRTLGPWVHLSAIAVGTLVTEDLTCISAGLLARQGRVDPFVGVLGCLIGIFVGDVGLWALGRLFGRRVLRWRWFARRLPEMRVEQFALVLDRHLGKAVIASRFLPGTRVPMYLAAGVVGRRPWSFVLWLTVAIAIWTPLLVLGSMIFGQALARPLQRVFGTGWLTWVVVGVILAILMRLLSRLFSWKGRTLLAASLSRIWRWEFWPTWLFYTPVAIWIGLLALRHRSLTLPTAANPAQPHGGFVGESKAEILARLPEEWILPAVLIDASDSASRLERFDEIMRESGWDFPVILKPNEGERGAGLRLARTREDAVGYLKLGNQAILVQQYHPGPYEAGLFYYRMPGEPHGRLFSITDKSFPFVVGDGEASVETLILRDRRLRMQHRVFRDRLGKRMREIPQAGERVRLAVAGNHCQGTMFTDGESLRDPRLERALDSIALHYDGFFYGRFDVRYTDVERFRAGRDMRIIELNGVTSESTNIYDPSWSLWRAYRTLFQQWAVAYRIGAANRDAGHRVSSVLDLWRAARAHYRARSVSDLAD